MIERLARFVLLVVVLLVAAPSGVLAQERTGGQEQAEGEAGWITVRPGDTLFSISRRHEVSIDDLRAWNDLSGNAIRAGMRLRIAPPIQSTSPPATEKATEEATGASEVSPVSDDEVEALDSDPAPDDSAAVAVQEVGTVTPLGGGMVAVTIGQGETLFSLANRFALTADSLAALNPGLPAALEAGMVVIVPDDRVARIRVVKPGDTLFNIARDEGVSVSRLREMNRLSGSSIRVGQQLTVPSASVGSDDSVNLPAAGQFSIRPYPDALDGRTLSTGRTYDEETFLVGHPELPAGSIVLVSTSTGAHAFAEVIETAPVRRPAFIEGSRKLFEALSLQTGETVTLHRVR